MNSLHTPEVYIVQCSCLGSAAFVLIFGFLSSTEFIGSGSFVGVYREGRKEGWKERDTLLLHTMCNLPLLRLQSR